MTLRFLRLLPPPIFHLPNHHPLNSKTHKMKRLSQIQCLTPLFYPRSLIYQNPLPKIITHYRLRLPTQVLLKFSRLRLLLLLSLRCLISFLTSQKRWVSLCLLGPCHTLIPHHFSSQNILIGYPESTIDSLDPIPTNAHQFSLDRIATLSSILPSSNPQEHLMSPPSSAHDSKSGHVSELLDDTTDIKSLPSKILPEIQVDTVAQPLKRSRSLSLEDSVGLSLMISFVYSVIVSHSFVQQIMEGSSSSSTFVDETVDMEGQAPLK